MARTSSSVLLLLVLYITCTAILASRHITVKLSCNNDTSFVETSCKSTTYPTVCVQYLLPYASKIQRSPKKVALVALSRSAANVHSCQNRKKLKNLKPIEYEAIADCLVVLSDSEELRIRFRSWSTWVNVVTWVSAAFTNEDIGLDGSQTRIWMVKWRIPLELRLLRLIRSPAMHWH